MNDRELLEFIAAQVGNLTGEVGSIKTDLQEVKTEVKKIQLDIENTVKPTLKIITEELINVKEKLQEHDERFDAIESKIESQDVEIKVLKRVK